jgi:hypothetical protein
MQWLACGSSAEGAAPGTGHRINQPQDGVIPLECLSDGKTFAVFGRRVRRRRVACSMRATTGSDQSWDVVLARASGARSSDAVPA